MSTPSRQGSPPDALGSSSRHPSGRGPPPSASQTPSHHRRDVSNPYPNDGLSSQGSQRGPQQYPASSSPAPQSSFREPSQQMMVARTRPSARNNGTPSHSGTMREAPSTQSGSYGRGPSAASRSSAAQYTTPTPGGRGSPIHTQQTPSRTMQTDSSRRMTPGAERQENRRLFPGAGSAGDWGSGLGSASLSAGGSSTPEASQRQRSAMVPYAAPPPSSSRQGHGYYSPAGNRGYGQNPSPSYSSQAMMPYQHRREHSVAHPNQPQRDSNDLSGMMDDLRLENAQMRYHQARLGDRLTAHDARFDDLGRDVIQIHADLHNQEQQARVLDSRMQGLEATAQDIRNQGAEIRSLAAEQKRTNDRLAANDQRHDESIRMLSQPSTPQVPTLPGAPLRLNLPGTQGFGLGSPRTQLPRSPSEYGSFATSPDGGVPLQSPNFPAFGAFKSPPNNQAGSVRGGQRQGYRGPSGPPGNFAPRSSLRITTDIPQMPGARGCNSPSRAPRSGGSAVPGAFGQQALPQVPNPQHSAQQAGAPGPMSAGGPTTTPGAGGLAHNPQKTIPEVVVIHNDLMERLVARYFTRRVTTTDTDQSSQRLLNQIRDHMGPHPLSGQIINDPLCHVQLLLGTLNRWLVDRILTQTLIEHAPTPHGGAFRAAYQEEARIQANGTPRERERAATHRAAVADRIRNTPGFYAWVNERAQERANEIENLFRPVIDFSINTVDLRKRLLDRMKETIKLRTRMHYTAALFTPESFRMGDNFDPDQTVYRSPHIPNPAAWDLVAQPAVVLSTTKFGWKETMYDLQAKDPVVVKSAIKPEILAGPRLSYGPKAPGR